MLYLFIVIEIIMYLNNEKLQLSSLRFRLRKRHDMRMKRLAEEKQARRVISMVERRLGKWIAEGKYKLNYDSIDDILRDLDLTSGELSFYCATRFGKPFLTWRKELRIEEAKDLLLRFPNVPVSKIGISLGIKDKSDFRHQFKSVTGMTPMEWREKNSRKNLVK